MDLGSFTTGLLTGLREGVEAALIVSIILAYLARTGNRRHFGPIWLGTSVAVLLSVAVGIVLWITIHELKTPYEQIFEGVLLPLEVAGESSDQPTAIRLIKVHAGELIRMRVAVDLH